LMLLLPLNHRLHHSFPTRRSSDLDQLQDAIRRTFNAETLDEPVAPGGRSRGSGGEAGVMERMLGSTVVGLGGQSERRGDAGAQRSEEHTSELQSRVELVCRLLLEQ